MVADLDINKLQPFNAFAVVTGSVKKILLPRHDVLIRHMNFEDDGTTASTATDHVVVMQMRKQDETAQAMSADRSAGEKLVIDAGLSITLRGDDIRDGPDGKREIQIQAVGNGAMLQFLTARNQLI